MRFDPKRHRLRFREATVPMINLAFLMLAFFLMLASLGAPPPFALDPPVGGAAQIASASTPVFLGADGRLVYGVWEGAAVFDALAERRGPIELRADADVPAYVVASLLARLAEIGIPETRLVLGAP